LIIQRGALAAGLARRAVQLIGPWQADPLGGGGPARRFGSGNSADTAAQVEAPTQSGTLFEILGLTAFVRVFKNPLSGLS